MQPSLRVGRRTSVNLEIKFVKFYCHSLHGGNNRRQYCGTSKTIIPNNYVLYYHNSII